jgi:YD repeat-containing protein
MKKIFTLLFVFALCFVAVNVRAQANREQDGLRGPVQSVSTEVAEFTTSDGKSVGGPRVPLHTVSYDARGNRVKRVDFNRDGSVAQTIVYNYDTEGRSLGFEDYVTGLSTPRKHIYALDQKGHRVEYRILQPTGKDGDEKYVYKYDENGNLVAEDLYHKTTLISRNENTYDQQGRLVSRTSYNPDSTVSSRIRISFAPDGKPVERTRHDGELLTYRVRYAYDSKGRLVEVETTGSYVETDSAFEYHVTGKVAYVYKGKDRPKEMLIYNPDGTLRERVLIEYDSRGNWTKRTHLVKAASNSTEVSRQIDYRTITYQ